MTHLNPAIANLSSPTIRDKMYRSTKDASIKLSHWKQGDRVSVTRDLIRIHAMKINYLVSILIILLAVSTSHQRSIGGPETSAEVESLATPWSVEDSPIIGERGVMSAETSDDETMAEATPWP